MKLHVLRFLLPACVAGMLLCLSQPLHAQSDPIKFGKVELADLQMKSYAPDTSAEAVILGDYGKSYFKYGPDGFQIVHDRHVRIKILKKSGYDGPPSRFPFTGLLAPAKRKSVPSTGIPTTWKAASR
jgi:hypothetical protein